MPRERKAAEELTETAKHRILKWLRQAGRDVYQAWWDRIQDDMARGMAGSAAEARALGTMLALSEWGELDPLPLRASRESKRPDFELGRHSNWFVEVCTAQMNDLERDRVSARTDADARLRDAALAALDGELEDRTDALRASATAETILEEPQRHGPPRQRPHRLSVDRIQVAPGKSLTMSVELREHRPAGPIKRGSTAFTQASALSSKKSRPDQIPDGAAGILWMDLCSPGWIVPADRTAPLVFWQRDISHAGTYGVWHSFYGTTDSLLFDDAGVPVGLGTFAVRQGFLGRFRHSEQRKWSAAVLLCPDGLVLFEHPEPLTLLPMSLLRSLISLPGYRPEFSFHRWSEHDTSLEHRLRAADDSITFVAGRVAT